MLTLKEEGVSHGIVAIGDGRLRESFSLRLEELGYQIASAIHPTALIPPQVCLGKGAIVLSGVNLVHNLSFGDYVYIGASVTVCHDTHVEDNVEICDGTTIGARIRVQKNAYVAMGVLIVPKDFGDLIIGEDAFLGVGSLVLNDVPPKAVVVGSPAKIIRYRDVE